MVFVKWPTWHDCQLWVDEKTEKMYYYDMSQWIEYTQSSENNGQTYWPVWKPVDWDDEVGVYDTDKPTDLFVWESGDKVSYVFKNYDGTVLKEGKVNEGTAPTPPANPTKPSTPAETFTFTGWNPEVAPITKKTTYTAQYEASPRNYTVTIGVSPSWAWTVDTQQVTVAYGTEISASDNVLTIWSNNITATAWSGYWFSSWGTLPAIVAADLTITATFETTVVDAPNRWPCPSGWHVPTLAELQAYVYTRFNFESPYPLVLPYNDGNHPINFMDIDGSVSSVVSYVQTAWYWSCEVDTNCYSGWIWPYALFSSEGNTTVENAEWDVYWMFIRPFKDTPSIPDESWDWVDTDAWCYDHVYFNTVTREISWNYDWEWYTMASRNLGATEDWISLTATTPTTATVGKLFQWGNNHWFDYEDATNTTESQIDTANYWPWNYYDSAVFAGQYGSRWQQEIQWLPWNSNLWGRDDLQPPY